MLAWLNLFCVFNLSSVVDPQSTFEGQDSTLICDDGGVAWLNLFCVFNLSSVVDPQSTFEGQDSTLICDDGGG